MATFLETVAESLSLLNKPVPAWFFFAATLVTLVIARSPNIFDGQHQYKFYSFMQTKAPDGNEYLIPIYVRGSK